MSNKQSPLRRLTLGQKPNLILGLVTITLAAVLIFFGVIGYIGLQQGKDSGFLTVVGLAAGIFTGSFAIAHLSFAILDRNSLRDSSGVPKEARLDQ